MLNNRTVPTTANKVSTGKGRPVIYSDKSESSIDEMMGDTPSNYNLANGRLDGKSLGLKAILLHAQKISGIEKKPNQL